MGTARTAASATTNRRTAQRRSHRGRRNPSASRAALNRVTVSGNRDSARDALTSSPVVSRYRQTAGTARSSTDLPGTARTATASATRDDCRDSATASAATAESGHVRAERRVTTIATVTARSTSRTGSTRRTGSAHRDRDRAAQVRGIEHTTHPAAASAATAALGDDSGGQ